MRTYLFGIFTFFVFSINITSSYAQQLKIRTSGTRTSIRGLSVVDDKTIWASGSNGMIARSVDGGANFIWVQIPNFEKRDFRDIEAFDSNTAIIIAIAEPAHILKTVDGGKTWKIVFADSTKGMFLDALSFNDKLSGIAIGDPIENKTFIATTSDGGNTWTKQLNTPVLEEGEAFFASSGTNILSNKMEPIFVSGGKKSNLYINNKMYPLPIVQGLESTGANSIAIHKNKAIVVGGDFSKDSIAINNCVLIDFKTMKFSKPNTSLGGYRSCVSFINKKRVIACGLNGIDISDDAGQNWKTISKESFHVVAKAKRGKTVFLAGSKGKIGTIIF